MRLEAWSAGPQRLDPLQLDFRWERQANWRSSVSACALACFWDLSGVPFSWLSLSLGVVWRGVFSSPVRNCCSELEAFFPQSELFIGLNIMIDRPRGLGLRCLHRQEEA